MELTIRINGKTIRQKAIKFSTGYKWDLPGYVIDRELQEKERDIDRNTEKGS
jgi:hypothetical protein